MRAPDSRATLVLIAVTVGAWLPGDLFAQPDELSLYAGFISARLTGMALPGALPMWITPLSATLVHAGIIHLGFNVLMLGYCGRYVQYALGTRGVLLVYVAGAYAAAAFQFLAGPHAQAPMIGASGAISGLVGAYALLFSRRRESAHPGRFGHLIHILWLAAAWIFVQLLVGVASASQHVPIAVGAHIGGFLAGLLLARPLLLWRYRNA